MSRIILITGAAGNIGRKLRAHFEGLGWTTRLLDVAARGDPAIHEADLGVWDEVWVKEFAGVDAVCHLAGDPGPGAGWDTIGPLNIDLCMNVYEAAARQGAKRLIFASSNWTMVGHRFEDGPLRPGDVPHPINPYGVSKLIGERLGRSYAERWGLSVICFRIGYNQHDPGNEPGPHMGWGEWGQAMWLSDRDMAQAFECAVEAPESVRFAVLNLMSDNPGMRWDLGPTRETIGYAPQDGAAPVVSDEQRRQAATARHAHELAEEARRFVMAMRW